MIEDFGVAIETNFEPTIEANILEPAIKSG